MKCIIGNVELSLDCEPVFDYGRTEARWEYSSQGYGEAIAHGGEGDVQLRLVTDLRVGFEGRGAHARTTLREGDRAFAALCWPRSQWSSSEEYWAERTPPATTDEAFERMERTAEYWRGWINQGVFPEHRWQSHLQRSALTLKGLTYAPTGALLAAATTSLPETPGGSRNYDYRYTWIRDATFMLWGLYTLGFEREANDFFYFVADVCDGEEDELQIMYGVGGEKELPEQELDHLSGYEDARPVRVGNAAATQRQHDVWGAVLDSVYLHAKSRDYLPERVWPMLKRAVECAIANWSKPDQGIWEVRGPPRHFTSSKLMCWVACDRGARLAKLHGDRDLAAAWRKAADEIHADICERGTDQRGVFVQHYDTTALDASVLLMPLLRFLPAEDPRIRDTVLAIADELTVDELVLRYKVEETDDGFHGEEGTFTICSFWLVSALVEIGEVARARQLCEKLLSYASPLAAVRRGARPPQRPPPRQLPPGLHPPRPDQRGRARHPGRGRRRRHPLPPPGRLPAVAALRSRPGRGPRGRGRARAPAVDRDGGAVDEAGLVRQQVGDHGRDLVGPPDPAHRVEPAHLLPDPLGRRRLQAGQQRLVALGVDRAEGDGVDPDAAGAVVDGQGAGQALDGRLGGGVGEGAGDGPAGLVGGDVDDRPAGPGGQEPADRGRAPTTAGARFRTISPAPRPAGRRGARRPGTRRRC